MIENLHFGRFEFRPAQRQFVSDGSPVPVGARAFELASVLIQHRHRVVTKSEIFATAWRGLIVEDNNLTVQISALRKLLGANAIATVPGHGYRWVLPPADVAQAQRVPGKPKPSIAVLPFENQSGVAGEDYFSEGLSEDISTSLSHSPWLLVIGYQSAATCKGARAQPQDVCSLLGAQYLVTGSVRYSKKAFRVRVELIDGASGSVAWSDRFDRPMEQLFDVQEEIVRRIAGTVEPLCLKHEELRASRKSAQDLNHWDLLMRARWHYWRSSQRHNNEAKKLLRQALATRPNDVAALSLLAFSLATDVWSGWASDPKETSQEAHRLAVRAVALDDLDSFAHFTLGVTLLGFSDVARAIAEQRRALELHPHFAPAAAELGRLLAFSGKPAEGRQLILQAMAASPAEPRMSLWSFSLAIASFVEGQYRDAAESAALAIAQRPDWFFNHFLLAASLSADGQLEPARVALAEGMRLMPHFNVATLRIGHPFTQAETRDRYILALKNVGWPG